MSRTIIVEVQVTVNDDEQAAKIYRAASDGTAEIAIRERVLCGEQVIVVPDVVDAPKAIVERPADESTEFKPLHTKPIVVKTIDEAPEVQEQPKRAKGIFGRNKLGRTGGGR